MMKKVLISLVFFLSPLWAQATSVLVEIDTGVNNVNALEGTLHYPSYIEVENIYTGGSTILLWITEPEVSATTHSIYFAGLTPGGFRGERAVFTIIGNFEKANLNTIYFTGVRALSNDGLGTVVPVKLKVLPTEINPDTAPPEPFKLFLAKSDDLFEGQRFISFATQDKDTGVSKFEVAEKFFGSPNLDDWEEGESPYLIKDNLMVKKVYVRAEDRAGNERLTSLTLPFRIPLMIFLAIIIGVLCISVLRSSRRSS